MAICTKLPHFFSICLIPICNDHFLCDPTSYFGPHLKFRIYMRFAFSTSSAYHYFDLKINTWLWNDEGYLSSAIVSLLDLNKKLLTIPIAFSTSTIPKLSFQKLEWFVRNCSYSCSLMTWCHVPDRLAELAASLPLPTTNQKVLSLWYISNNVFSFFSSHSD